MNKPKQWHPSVTLEDFVKQVSDFEHIVELATSHRLRLFDRDDTNFRNAFGWATHIEQVIGSLSMEWQREALADALKPTSSSNCAHSATPSRLREARRWFLRSMLGSTFLDKHPKPADLLRSILTEYESLSNEGQYGTGLPRAKSDGVQQPRPLASFIDDATNILKSRGGTAALSHAHSSLSVCADTGAVASNVLRGPFAPEQFPGDTLDTLSVPGNGKRWRSDRWCSQYEFRVETAQKRSYASICYYTLCPTDDRRNGYCSWRQYDDESIHFISDLTALARTDIVVMEVMCLLLLEPQRRHHREQAQGKQDEQGGGTASYLQKEKIVSTMRMVLKQVLSFRGDERLWSMDVWLLTELSEHYLPFADAYLARLLSDHSEAAWKEPWNGHERYDAVQVGGREVFWTKLTVLSSRSNRLQRLCQTALLQGALSPDL